MTESITTGANFLVVTFSAVTSNSSSNKVAYFAIFIDGVRVFEGGLDPVSANGAANITLVYRGAVTAAAHTIDVKWSTSGGTEQIRPVAALYKESASLLVEEVSV
jgi:hypothetical protein